VKSNRKHNNLNGKQLRYLRGLGHHLKPLIILGREGITENVISAAKAVLAAHELVKVKVGNGCFLERQEAAEAIAERTGAQVVQILGKTFLIFQENPERHAKQKIKLP
jgi:RNA-binding protein